MISVAQLFTVGQTDHGCVKNLGTAVGSLEGAVADDGLPGIYGEEEMASTDGGT